MNSKELQFWRTMHNDRGIFPIKGVASLAPLFRKWQERKPAHPAEETVKGLIDDLATQHPRLARDPIVESNISACAQHLQLLLTLSFSMGSWEEELWAAQIPLSSKKILATPRFVHTQLHRIDHIQIAELLMIQSYLKLFREVYGWTLDYNSRPIVVTGEELAHVNISRFYEFSFDLSLCEIHSVSTPPMTDGMRQTILENLDNIDLWMKLIPPSAFELHGIMLTRLREITTEKVLNDLTSRLVAQDTIVLRRGFSDIERQVRLLLKRDDVFLGLMSYQGKGKGDAQFVRYAAIDEQASTHTPFTAFDISIIEDSVYAECLESIQPVVIGDLESKENMSVAEQLFVEAGIRSLVVFPLYFEDQHIGFLEIGSRAPNAFTYLSIGHLSTLAPLFSMVVKRVNDQFETRLHNVIRQHCTAIHPSVEWCFREAAKRHLSSGASESIRGMEPIVFKDVFPLYGASDIRGSSSLRAAAIQADLLKQIDRVEEILECEFESRSLPVLERLAYQVRQQRLKIEKGLRAGDEFSVVHFLQDNVARAFSLTDVFGSKPRKLIAQYKQDLDQNLNFIYQERRAFEESVSILNRNVSRYLTEQEELAQQIYPHYFEKQATDGIDHSLFVGASLCRDRRFDPLYLENLRLWQLKLMCGIAALAEITKEMTAVQLDLAHVVVVQKNSISVRFDYEEKKFVVAGAYDVRYEIMKSRIDKARIKRSSERVTQPGKLAIVYSSQDEREEYLEYLQFLIETNYLEQGVEELELENLKGMHGVHALRVGIDLDFARKQLERSETVPLILRKPAA